MTDPRPLLIQIGFNKCATTALAVMLTASGYSVLHSNAPNLRRNGHPQVAGRRPQKVIARNMRKGRLPFHSLEDFDAHLDMELLRPTRVIENFRRYPLMAEAYPNARFLLNIRNKAAWLRSRARHRDGKYLAHIMRFHGESAEEVLARWSEDFDRHIAAVQAHFAGMPERLCVFHIDRDPIEKLAEFTAPIRPLNVAKWERIRITDRIAEKKEWRDEAGDMDLSGILEAGA